jgi:hypothetical protein
MNVAIQYNSPALHQSNTVTIIDLIKLHNTRRDLSSGQKVVLTALRLACGYRGSIRYSIKKFANCIGLGATQTREYLSSLVAMGLVKRILVPGRSSWWILPDQLDTSTVHRRTIIKEEKRTNDNVVLKVHESKPFDMNLVLQIEQITGDRNGRGCYIKIVRSVSPDIVHAAISSLKIAMSEDIVVKPAAYFVQTIKNYCPDLFTSRQGHTPRPPQPVSNVSFQTKILESEPNIEIDWKINLAQLKNIQQMLGKPSRNKAVI